MSTGGPSISLLRTSTSGHAVVELTTSSIDSPPRRVGNQNPPNNDDVIDSRADCISVNDLQAAGSRVCLESTRVLMHILAIGESALPTESNRLCSNKTRSRVNNDRCADLVTAAELASMDGFEVVMDRREVLEELDVEVMPMEVGIRRQEPVVDRVRPKGVARGRISGLDLLPFIHENIPSERDLSAPTLSIFVSTFRRGHDVFRDTQTSNQISGVLERKDVDVLLIGRMKMGNSSNFLIEVVVPDLSRASLVNRRQLN